MPFDLVPMVEGESEAKSVPILLNRIIHEIMEVPGVRVVKPFRVRRDQVVAKPERLQAAVMQAVRDRTEHDCTVGGLLILLDADKDCPAELVDELNRTAQSATVLPARVVFAQRGFEHWFLGAIDSLQGRHGIRADAEGPAKPEEFGGSAKRFLSGLMEGNRKYNTVLHQEAFVDTMNLAQCADACPSFRKYLRDLAWVIRKMKDLPNDRNRRP